MFNNYLIHITLVKVSIGCIYSTLRKEKKILQANTKAKGNKWNLIHTYIDVFGTYCNDHIKFNRVMLKKFITGAREREDCEPSLDGS